MYGNMCSPKEKELKTMKNITLLDTITDAREAKEHGFDHNILWDYDHTQEAKLERLDIEDLGFSDGYDTIEENLNRFGITELTISTTSTSLMGNLTALKNMGFTPVDLIQIETGRTNCNFKTKTEEEIKSAILLKKNEE